MYLVALYEEGLGYGGPEEGGWWYETGDLCRVVACARTADAAYDKAFRANRLLSHLQRNKRPVHSAAYEGGRHVAVVFRHVAPLHYPDARPHYE